MLLPQISVSCTASSTKPGERHKKGEEKAKPHKSHRPSSCLANKQAKNYHQPRQTSASLKLQPPSFHIREPPATQLMTPRSLSPIETSRRPNSSSPLLPNCSRAPPTNRRLAPPEPIHRRTRPTLNEWNQSTPRPPPSSSPFASLVRLLNHHHALPPPLRSSTPITVRLLAPSKALAWTQHQPSRKLNNYHPSPLHATSRATSEDLSHHVADSPPYRPSKLGRRLNQRKKSN